MKTETVNVGRNKKIHVMGREGQIFCNLTQNSNTDIQISFEYETPVVLQTEIVVGEHGPYLLIKVLY